MNLGLPFTYPLVRVFPLYHPCIILKSAYRRSGITHALNKTVTVSKDTLSLLKKQYPAKKNCKARAEFFTGRCGLRAECVVVYFWCNLLVHFSCKLLLLHFYTFRANYLTNSEQQSHLAGLL